MKKRKKLKTKKLGEKRRDLRGKNIEKKIMKLKIKEKKQGRRIERGKL